ncbi:MAG: HMA2 domain-containing protein [Salinibacter sp.]
MASYLHALDGRIRVRFPEMRGDRRAAARLRQELRALPGITAVEVTPLTGSVLVEYDEEQCSAPDIYEALDIDPPSDTSAGGTLLKAESSGQQIQVRNAVAKSLVEFAAERLLLAVLA